MKPTRKPAFPLADRSLFLLLAAGALGIDAAGFALQSLLRLDPCPLCIFQRFLFLVLALLGVIGAILPFTSLRRFLGWLVVLISLGGLATASYQSWMQAFPEQFSHACNYSDPTLIEQFVDWLGTYLPTLFMASGLCTSKAWSLLGLSMANWAMLTFTLISLLTLWRLRYR